MCEQDKIVAAVDGDGPDEYSPELGDNTPTMWVARYEFAKYVYQDWPGSIRSIEELPAFLSAIFAK